MPFLTALSSISNPDPSSKKVNALGRKVRKTVESIVRDSEVYICIDIDGTMFENHLPWRAKRPFLNHRDSKQRLQGVDQYYRRRDSVWSNERREQILGTQSLKIHVLCKKVSYHLRQYSNEKVHIVAERHTRKQVIFERLMFIEN